MIVCNGKRIKYFAKFGWRCIIVWEESLNNDERAVIKEIERLLNPSQRYIS